MVKLGIVGCSGRMGMSNATLACDDENIIVSAALENKGHVNIGKKLSSIITTASVDTVITDDIDTFIKDVDVIVDFTIPNASLAVLEKASKHKKNYVLGTTGFTGEQREQIRRYSNDIAIVFSSNMSVGMNVLFKLVYEASKMLSDYDIEIIEKHHNKKKDSPSGSAITLAENVTLALNLDLKDSIINGREGFVGERTKKEIGMHAVRGGDIVGEHTVLFAVRLLHL